MVRYDVVDKIGSPAVLQKQKKSFFSKISKFCENHSKHKVFSIFLGLGDRLKILAGQKSQLAKNLSRLKTLAG
jgi:dimeric dUTPase (all-alpha-NTP-PPase superfamily)